MGEKDPPFPADPFLLLWCHDIHAPVTMIEINMLFASVCKFMPEVILIIAANGCMTACHWNNLELIASICCFFFWHLNREFLLLISQYFSESQIYKQGQTATPKH